MCRMVLNDVGEFMINSFNYDPVTDRLQIEYWTEDPASFKNDLLKEGALDDISIDDLNSFHGYTKLTHFSAQYSDNIFKCFVILVQSETQYQKLVNRVSHLEESKAELTAIKRDISALQLVNAKSLSEKGLISSEIAARLAENAAELDNVDGQITIGDLKGGALK